MTHYVYRLFDGAGELLYIGCSKNPHNRFKQHRTERAWWAWRVARGRISCFPDTATARAAERKAIQAERPRYNIQHRWNNNHEWSREDFVDYVRTLMEHPLAKSSEYTRQRVSIARSIYHGRFGEPMPRVMPQRRRRSA